MGGWAGGGGVAPASFACVCCGGAVCMVLLAAGMDNHRTLNELSTVLSTVRPLTHSLTVWKSWHTIHTSTDSVGGSFIRFISIISDW